MSLPIYPYTNMSDTNLDWLISEVKRIIKEWGAWSISHQIKFADPIEWNSSTFYPIYTIVLDPNTGDSYFSKQDVPAGVPLSNNDYWQLIASFSAQLDAIRNASNFFNMKYGGADLTGATACDDVLDLAIASGKNIYFPKGTYLLSRQHTFENVDVIGNGAIIHTTSFGHNQGVMNSYGGFNSTYDQMVFRLKADVHMSGFIFDNIDAGAIVIQGDNTHVKECKISTFASIAGSTGYYGIVVRNCANIHIKDVNIEMQDGNNRDGIHIESMTHDVFIDDCHIVAGDDGLAFNALEGQGGAIYNVYVNNCYIGGYGVRFFGVDSTPIYHVEINNCTIEITSPTMQSGCIRFSNSTNTIGGTPIGADGFFNNIAINNCNLVGNASVNLSIYCFHAYVACRLNNCTLYNVVYYDASTQSTHIHFTNCLLNETVNVTPDASFTSIEMAECDIKALVKSGNGILVATLTDVNISNALDISGVSADFVRLTNCFINPVGVVLSTNGATFSINNTRVQSAFNFEAGQYANYFISNLIGSGGVNVITNASRANRISCDCMIDDIPSQPINTDHVIIGNIMKYYLAGQWLNVNMTA